MFYTNCVCKNEKIYLKFYDAGQGYVQTSDLQPYLFVEGPGEKYKTIKGKSLYKKNFSSLMEVQNFIDSGKSAFCGLGVSHRKVNEKDFAYAYISDTFTGDVEYDLSCIKIVNIDIETSSEKGFPQVDDPQEPILAITCSVTSGNNRIYRTFGLKKSSADNYVYCEKESELLNSFFDFMKEQSADVITGWNVETFDIAYICARTEAKYKKEWLKKLSPFGLQPRKSQVNILNKKVTIWRIDGISVLDYLDLYKTFTYSVQESYKLDHIAFVELGERKLDYSEHRSLNELWKKDWEKFIEYNKKDVTLVDKLVDKLKLIELVVSIAYFTKVNFTDALEKIRPIEILMYNYLMKTNVVLPLRESKEKSEANAGGRVKEPKIGISEWVVTLDATSLYPSIMMSLNLSPDTFIKKLDVSPNEILTKTFSNGYLLNNNYAMSVNGCLFSRDKKGFTTEIVEHLFNVRDEYKTKMKELKKLGGDENLIKKYDVFQLAIKILANSVYGAFAAPYFLFFDMDIAEAITLTGQVVAQEADRAANKYLNGLLKSNKDYVTFSDTDSIGVELNSLVLSINTLKTNKQKVEFLDKFVDTKISPALVASFDELSQYLNLYQNRIHFKREKIAEKVIITSKKRYGMLVWDDEGTRYDEPKIVIKGLELIKSSTPEYVKESLKQALKIIFIETEKDLQAFIEKFKKEFLIASPEQIAFPRGVSDITKYEHVTKGVPIHVRASLIFNKQIQELGLNKHIETIRDGDKMKFIYLKLPNPLRENVVGFKDFIPTEFNINTYIDYDTQFDKTFMGPLNGIIEKIGWSAEKTNDLSDYF